VRECAFFCTPSAERQGILVRDNPPVLLEDLRRVTNWEQLRASAPPAPLNAKQHRAAGPAAVQRGPCRPAPLDIGALRQRCHVVEGGDEPLRSREDVRFPVRVRIDSRRVELMRGQGCRVDSSGKLYFR
jgi:hypothetical protein